MYSEAQKNYVLGSCPLGPATAHGMGILTKYTEQINDFQ